LTGFDFGKDTPAWARKRDWTLEEIRQNIDSGRIILIKACVLTGEGMSVLTFEFIPIEDNEVDKLIDWM